MIVAMNLPRLLLVMLLAAHVGCAAKSAPRAAATSPAPAPATTTAAAPFAKEIAAFEAIDRSTAAPAKGGIVFYGSSSIRNWKSLPNDFPGMPVINRGFGGSRMDQCTMYVDRVLVPLKPRAIFVYAGDNDLAAGRSVERVVSDTREFVETVQAKLPQTRIAFISIKPSPSRAKLLDKMKDANAQIKAMAVEKGFEFVDVATPMLGADGQPRAELFGPDMLHMNAAGYELWTGIVKPFLK
jgi:lysophospholipase L1-like esterase